MTTESKPMMKGACTPGMPVLTARRFITGLLALAMALFAVLAGNQLKHRYPFEHDFHDKIDSPVLAVELPSNAEQLKEVSHTAAPATADAKSEAGAAVASLRTNTYEDFVFILLYTSYLWQFAGLFASGGDSASIVHRRAIAGLAILIALFDCAENIGILRALNASDLNKFPAQVICFPSRCKWGLFALALLLTAWILAKSASLIYSLPTKRLLALGYATAGALLLIGLLKPHVIEVATNVFALPVGINLVGLLGPYVERWLPRPRIPEYVQDFCNRKDQRHADVAVYPKTL
jgi:hypothetical protein